MDERIRKLASNLLNHSVRLKKDEKILIEMIGTDCSDLAIELIKKSKEIGEIKPSKENVFLNREKFSPTFICVIPFWPLYSKG